MSPFETFFALGFVSTLACALIATWFRYVVPRLISLYRTLAYYMESAQFGKVRYGSRQVTDTELNIQPPLTPASLAGRG